VLVSYDISRLPWREEAIGSETTRIFDVFELKIQDITLLMIFSHRKYAEDKITLLTPTFLLLLYTGVFLCFQDSLTVFGVY